MTTFIELCHKSQYIEIVVHYCNIITIVSNGWRIDINHAIALYRLLIKVFQHYCLIIFLDLRHVWIIPLFLLWQPLSVFGLYNGPVSLMIFIRSSTATAWTSASRSRLWPSSSKAKTRTSTSALCCKYPIFKLITLYIFILVLRIPFRDGAPLQWLNFIFCFHLQLLNRDSWIRLYKMHKLMLLCMVMFAVANARPEPGTELPCHPRQVSISFLQTASVRVSCYCCNFWAKSLSSAPTLQSVL